VRDVSFRHTPDDAGGFERVLGCPIHSKAPSDGFRVSRDAWRLPLRRRDPVLRQMLEGQANEILVRLPARTGLALEVQRALASRVAGGARTWSATQSRRRFIAPSSAGTG
jgi:hypothetical protein